MIFEQETYNNITSYFAIQKDVVIGNKQYDELLYAEIQRGMVRTEESIYDGWVVVWQDDWQNKIPFNTLDEAKQYVLTNYLKHTGHINGNTYEIDNRKRFNRNGLQAQ